MSTAKTFFQKILTIDGVSGCAMAKFDGTIVGHCLGEPEKCLQLLRASSQPMQKLNELPGFKDLKSVRYRLPSGEDCYLLPLGKYLLAVVCKATGGARNLAAEVLQRVEVMKKAGSVAAS